jgi:nicotinate-nucleotide pyrophosphorylase (carboxylating)
MLDNFDAKNAEKIAKQIRKNNSSILIEISGGINPDNIVEYASFADRISLGYLTHSVKNKDISLDLK